MADPVPRTGWTVFAGIVFFTVGVANIAFGLAALVRSGYFPEGGLLYEQLTYSGWVWLIGGAIEVLLAYGISQGMSWGRIGGIILAVVMTVWWFFEMLYLPVLGLLIVIMYVLVIYALSVHRDEFA
jgi:hypothetical protein